MLDGPSTRRRRHLDALRADAPPRGPARAASRGRSPRDAIAGGRIAALEETLAPGDGRARRRYLAEHGARASARPARPLALPRRRATSATLEAAHRAQPRALLRRREERAGRRRRARRSAARTSRSRRVPFGIDVARPRGDRARSSRSSSRSSRTTASTLDGLAAESARAVACWGRARMTFRGDFLGLAPTGRTRATSRSSACSPATGGRARRASASSSTSRRSASRSGCRSTRARRRRARGSARSRRCRMATTVYRTCTLCEATCGLALRGRGRPHRLGAPRRRRPVLAGLRLPEGHRDRRRARRSRPPAPAAAPHAARRLRADRAGTRRSTLVADGLRRVRDAHGARRGRDLLGQPDRPQPRRAAGARRRSTRRSARATATAPARRTRARASRPRTTSTAARSRSRCPTSTAPTTSSASARIRSSRTAAS